MCCGGSGLNKYVKLKRKRRIIVLLLSILVLFFVLDFRLRPIIKTISVSKARVISTNAINEAVLHEIGRSGVEYSNLVNVERGEDGKVLAITTNTQKVNELRSNISIEIQEILSNIKMRQVGLPIGTLTGIEILNGVGPTVPLRITVSGSVITQINSKFSEAGINQTKHQIFIDVHTKISAMIPGYPATSEVDTNILIAETIIIGEVPKVYANTDNEKLRDMASLSQFND